MAKENFAMLHGHVVKAPKIYVSKETGRPIKAVVPLLTIRRPFLRKGQSVPSRFDYPIVWSSDEAVIKKIQELKAGDMVDIRGTYTTRAVKKSSICECGHTNSTKGSKSFISAIYVCRREESLSEDDAMNLLRDRCEVSNLINIIGYVIRDPETYQDEEKHQQNTQYQIAANRLIHLDGEITDYPIIKSYGKQAAEDAQRLKKGSMIYVSGSLQTREFEKKIQCENCGCEYLVRDTTMEIAPYHVEYLANCDLRMADENGKLIDLSEEEAEE